MNSARCAPPLDEDEVRGIARSAGRYDPAPPDPEIDLRGDPVDPDRLPAIQLSVQDLRILTARSWDALIEANTRRPFLFRYGGAPVRVEHDETGRPVLRELTADRVVHELARAAEFLGWSPKAREWRVTRPPRYVALDVLATPDPPLPVVTRLTECPTFAPDGTLQTDGGYHPASLTYCAAPNELRTVPAVAEAPSDAEAADALRLLADEVLGDFPFVSHADKANALGLGLLPYVRDLIPGPTPLHLFEAPVPGSGKGICIEALLRPSCGRSVGAVAQAGDDDEWRKRITAVLRDGLPAVLVDNVTKPLDAGSLAMALTAAYWTDRVLGASETVRLPVRCAWVASANNPTFSTEIARRTVRVRIDPRTDRPWERTGWRHPELLSWVDEHRPLLVWAALTLVRRWLARGRPVLRPGPRQLRAVDARRGRCPRVRRRPGVPGQRPAVLRPGRLRDRGLAPVRRRLGGGPRRDPGRRRGALPARPQGGRDRPRHRQRAQPADPIRQGANAPAGPGRRRPPHHAGRLGARRHPVGAGAGEAMRAVNVSGDIHRPYQIGQANVVNVGECSAPFSRAQESRRFTESPCGAQHSPTFTGARPLYLVGPVNVGPHIHRPEAVRR